MAITTYATLVSDLGTLAVSGVTRKYGKPPSKLNTADLPASWVQLPTGEEGAMTYQTAGGWPMLQAELVIAVAPTGGSLTGANFDSMVTMLDNLSTALRGLRTGKAQNTWRIDTVIVTVAGIDYWGIVARVTARG